MRIALAACLALAVPAAAQMPTEAPGKPDPKLVTAGTYQVDSAHTQIVYNVMHLGFNSYWGIFGGATGSLTIDPARPQAASVEISIPMAGITSTSKALDDHLRKADFFDAAKFPTATFKSTSVTVSGTTAKIAGTLTIKGIAKPVVLDARFTGAGKGPMPPNALNVGFEATTSIKRSDFGISYGIPLVPDEVPLKITAAFEKK